MKYTKEYLEKLDRELKFIPLTYDQLFKKIFSNNKELLKAFLISVLKLNHKQDYNIDILTNELPKEQYNEYGSRVDITVIINNKIKVNIEINQEKFENILDRNFLYITKEHTLNIKKGINYKDFYKYETIQLNLNTNTYGTEINGEDIFYLKSNNTDKNIINNFKIIIKDLNYYKKIYKTTNKKEHIWLALLMSESFTELESVLNKLMSIRDKDYFIKEVINMCEDAFFAHSWMQEEMNQIVEGRKLYNEEQKRKQYEQKIIKNMLNKKISYKDIKEITSKSIKYIKEIEKSIKE